MRIGLVTEELSFGSGSGGIGGAFHELALALTRSGYETDLIFLPADLALPKDALLAYYADRGIRVVIPDLDRHVWGPLSYEKRSYALFRHFAELETGYYGAIHFHDYKGLAYFSLTAKAQRLAFAQTSLVVQAHGPTRWALEANGHPFTHEDQLKIDFMERESIARADVLVSPSHYMLQWLKEHGWGTPPKDRVHVIQNVCSHIQSLVGTQATTDEGSRRFNEIVFFGRHEGRKGIV